MFTSKLLRSFVQGTCLCTKRLYRKNKADNIDIVVSTEYSKQTTDFIIDIFKKDEPTTSCMELEDFTHLRRFFDEEVHGSWTLMAVNKSNKKNLLGLMVLKERVPSVYQQDREFSDSCDEKTRRLINLWADYQESCDIFKYLGVDQLLEIVATGVYNEARRSGVSGMMATAAEELAKQEGFPALIAECTNLYSSLRLSSLGYKCLPPKHMLSFLDSEGRPWLSKSPPHPHGHMITAYKLLS